MNSRTAINLFLLALVAIFGALAYFKPGLEEESTVATLTTLQPADVARIRIERADAEDVAFERRDGKWWMTDPVQAPANEVRVEGVLRIAQAESPRQYPASEVDLIKVGLDHPEVMLFFNDAPPIAFGDIEQLTSARYVRIGGAVHLIEDTGYYHVIGGYPTFLDNSLLPGDVEIEGLSLPGLKLTRADGRWRVQPEPVRFSADQANQLLEEWHYAQATNLRRFSGGDVQGEIAILLKGQAAPVQFGIVGRSPELVLVRLDLGLEYHLPAEAAARLLKLPEPAESQAPGKNRSD